MDRYWQANTVPNAPVAPSDNAGGFPANGNPAVGITGTVPGAWWYHLVSEEIRNAIIALGVSPDFTQTDQLAQALLAALAHVAVSISYDDLVGAPGLAKVATSGSYTDLVNAPAVPAPQINADWNAASGLAQILNKPAIPPAQVNADWNAASGVAQILNRPSQLTTLPLFVCELGNSGQANGGLGIDMGGWYQFDFHIGTNSYNGMAISVNSDGTANIPSGIYLVCGGAKIIATGTDTYMAPPQLILATGQAYSFPGVYQYAVQRYPEYPNGIQIHASGGLAMGYASISGAMASWSNSNRLWLGFSKVPGSVSQLPCQLQGYISYIKVG